MANCFFFDFAMHALDIAIDKAGFEAPICLGCANCSRLVISAYLRRLDGIKLI